MADLCPFCEIIAGRAPATVLHTERNALVIVPLQPVVTGHVLVIPRAHVTDFTEDATLSAYVMALAAEYAADRPGTYSDCNVITSRGRAATQSVFHLHLHLVPRAGYRVELMSADAALEVITFDCTHRGDTDDDV